MFHADVEVVEVVWDIDVSAVGQAVALEQEQETVEDLEEQTAVVVEAVVVVAEAEVVTELLEQEAAEEQEEQEDE